MRKEIYYFCVLNTIILISFYCVIYNLSSPKLSYEPFKSFWNELDASDEQILVNQTILSKTFQFMIDDIEEDDPMLVSFVKSLVIQPSSNVDLNKFPNKSPDGLSERYDKILKSKYNGFLVEAGIFDGELEYTSLYFEKVRNWSGILIEPVPSFYKNLLSKERNFYKINVCVSSGKPKISKIKYYSFSSNLEEENKNNNFEKLAKFLYVPCFSLNTILKAINITKVDLIAIDFEGNELNAIRGINFDKYKISLITILHKTKDIAKNFMLTEYMRLKDYNAFVFDYYFYFIKKNLV